MHRLLKGRLVACRGAAAVSVLVFFFKLVGFMRLQLLKRFIRASLFSNTRG